MKKKTCISRKVTSKTDFKKFFSELRKQYPLSVANYGESNDGYAYSCGCEYDCCGHLTRYSFNEINFKKGNGIIHAVITHSFDYNY